MVIFSPKLPAFRASSKNPSESGILSTVSTLMMISPVPVPFIETMVKSMANVVPTWPRAGRMLKDLNFASPLSLTNQEEEEDDEGIRQ